MQPRAGEESQATRGSTSLDSSAEVWSSAGPCAKFFGTLGSGWLATLQVGDLGDAMTAAAWQSGLLMAIQAILGGFTVVFMYGRWPAVRVASPLVMIIGSIQGIGQTVVTLFDPVLAASSRATLARGPIAEETARGLRLRGHPVKIAGAWEGSLGHAQAIRIDAETGWFEGGADPRGDGAAIGY